MKPDIKQVPIVTCSDCSREHVYNDTTYMAVLGDITIGMSREVVTGNVTDGKVTAGVVLCPGCLKNRFSTVQE